MKEMREKLESSGKKSSNISVETNPAYYAGVSMCKVTDACVASSWMRAVFDCSRCKQHIWEVSCLLV